MNIFIHFLDFVNNHPCLQLLFYVNQQKIPSPPPSPFNLLLWKGLGFSDFNYEEIYEEKP